MEASGGLFLGELKDDVGFLWAAGVSGISDADEAAAGTEMGVGVAQRAVGLGWLRDDGGVAARQITEVEDSHANLATLFGRQDVGEFCVATQVQRGTVEQAGDLEQVARGSDGFRLDVEGVHVARGADSLG